MVDVFRWLLEDAIRKARIQIRKERKELDSRKTGCVNDDIVTALNTALKKMRSSTNELVRAKLSAHKLKQVHDVCNLRVGDVVVNGNRLVQRNYTSENFLRVGHVTEILPNKKVRVSWVEPLYHSGSSYNNERVYSQSWMEKAFWYKRPIKENKSMSDKVYVVVSPTETMWSVRIAGAVYKQHQMIDNAATAELVAQQAATDYAGKEFYVCKAQMKVVKNCLSVTRFDD